MTIICYQVFPSGRFRFQYQLINLVWVSFDFFSFSWSLAIYFFVALYSCICSYPKILRNVFYLQLFASLKLKLQSICFICTTWKHKKSMEQQRHRACKLKAKWKQKTKNESKSTPHSNWPRVLLFDLAHKQYNGIIRECKRKISCH